MSLTKPLCPILCAFLLFAGVSRADCEKRTVIAKFDPFARILMSPPKSKECPEGEYTQEEWDAWLAKSAMVKACSDQFEACVRNSRGMDFRGCSAVEKDCISRAAL